MKIVINGKFLENNITGVQRYAREILRELDKISKTGEIEIAIPKDAKNIPKLKNINIITVGKLKGRIWEQISLPLYVRKRQGISLNLCNISPIVSPGIICIADAKVKAHPEFFHKRFVWFYNFIVDITIKKARELITVSQFSKKEIMKYYSAEQNIKVVPCAWQHFDRIPCSEDALEKYKIEKYNYYLSVSTLEPNKNVNWIINTAMNMPNDTFIVAGSRNKKVFKNEDMIKTPQNVKFIGYVKDQDLKSLLINCKGYLFPTIYEGFGMPPLEAMSVGVKNICVSDTEVMHEIFENSVTYIDNSKPADQLEFIDKTALYERILKKYSWHKSAGDIYRILCQYIKVKER